MLQSNYSPGKGLSNSTMSKKKSIKKVMKDGGPQSPSGKISFNQRNSKIDFYENPEEPQMTMMQSFQAENSQLTFEMGEKDVEIERMKTTLVALNSKLQQWEEMKNNCTSSAESLALSEQKRGELQNYIQESGLQVSTDGLMHSSKKEELMSHIADMQAECKGHESNRALTETRHQTEIEDLKSQLHYESAYYQKLIKEMTEENDKKMHELMVQLADLKASHANELDEKNLHLETSIGDHRKVQSNLLNGYESQINELKQDHFKMLTDLKGDHNKKEEAFNKNTKDLGNSHNQSLTKLKGEQKNINSQYFDNLRSVTDKHLNEYKEHAEKHDEHLRSHGEKLIGHQNKSALQEKEILAIHAKEKLNHKIAMNMRDSLHKKQIQDLRNQQLDELKRHRGDREQREANNRAYVNQLMENHSEQLKTLQDSHSEQTKSIQNEHQDELTKLRLTSEEKEALHIQDKQKMHNDHTGLRESTHQQHQDALQKWESDHNEFKGKTHKDHTNVVTNMQNDYNNIVNNHNQAMNDLKTSHQKQFEKLMTNGEEAKLKKQKDHDTIVQQLNGSVETMKKLNKEHHDDKDGNHASTVNDLKSSHLDELKRTRADREQREANNRAYVNQLMENHSEQLKTLQDSHSEQTKSIQNEHQDELTKLRLTSEEKEALHIQMTADLHGEHNGNHEELHDANQELLKKHYNEIVAIKEDHSNTHNEVLDGHHNLLTDIKSEHAGKLSEIHDQHKKSLRKLNDELHQKEKSNIDSIQKMQNAHSQELARKLQEKIMVETQHKLAISMLSAQHKRDKDSTNGSNVKDLTTYDKKLIEQQNQYSEKLRQLAKERSDYDVKIQGHLSNLGDTHDQKFTELRSEKEVARAQREQEHQGLINDHEGKQRELRAQLDQHILDLKNAQNTHDHLSSKVLSHELLLAKKEDVESQYSESLDREGLGSQNRTRLQGEVDSCTDYILQLEEKVYRAHKTSLELLKQLKDAEIEIQGLKDRIYDLQSKIAVYIPVKQDSIDKKLAEYINNFPERQKLKILFMRESEGVYQFGTKRVAVKVDMDRINIRVGGGYLSIDEFLDQYTPVELQKLERKDPIRRFNEKVAVQKTLINRAARETSPVDVSPGRSGSPMMTSALGKSKDGPMNSVRNILKMSM